MSGDSPPPPAPPSPPMHAHPHSHNNHIQPTRLSHSHEQNYQEGIKSSLYQPQHLHEIGDQNVRTEFTMSVFTF